MALRFYFDECTDEDVARALISRGLDVVTVSGLGRKGWPDEDHLRSAMQERRVLYSTDRHFLLWAGDFLTRGEDFAGIAYHAPNTRSKRQIIDALLLLDGVMEPSQMLNHIEYI